MPKEIFEVVRERFHLSDRTQYIVQGHWPKDAVMEAYLDQHKLKVSVKENENVSALERFKDPEKMQGIQITATVQIPENLEGYHKLVIYEKFPDKKHVWFSITAGHCSDDSQLCYMTASIFIRCTKYLFLLEIKLLHSILQLIENILRFIR